MKMEFRDVGFCGERIGKPRNSEKKILAARQEQATHIHLFCTGLESNLSHIGGR